MGKPTGFLEIDRSAPSRRTPKQRVKDFREFDKPWSEQVLRDQGARCMDCGVPTCHGETGCPLGNLIPDWNDLIYRGDWEQALHELHRTNNFPDVTGRICPAPCEDVCILGLIDDPVTIKAIEKAIIDRGFEEGWVRPQPPAKKTWKRVAVVGSGPAGLAGAQQLARMGHQVTVFEKADRFGGLLMYGIPDFKMEKTIIERRIEQMRQEGVTFQANTEVGKHLSAAELRNSFDAVLLAGGAEQARPLPEDVEGRDLKGIHPAMDFLPQQNRRNQGDVLPPDDDILAAGKTVVVLGGGDTGSDCIGTSHRQGAREVLNFELLGKPPKVKTSTSHEEGGQRRWGVLTKGFEGKDGRVTALRAVEVEWIMPGNNGGPPQMREIPGSEFVQPADLVLLAMGFTGPMWNGLLTDMGLAATPRGTVQRDRNYMTSERGIFVAGDMTRGASLVVWAIAEGREAATGIDRYLRAL